MVRGTDRVRVKHSSNPIRKTNPTRKYVRQCVGFGDLYKKPGPPKRGNRAALDRFPPGANCRFLRLDPHAETIAVAIAEPGGEFSSIGTIPNRLESIRKMIGKLGLVKELRACYEAGPTGYVIYWQLTAIGVECQVVAPTLVPVKAGDW
jgi:hypothetical protein